MEGLQLESSLIGIAAFLHDIGKVYQRTGLKLSDKYSKDSYDRQLILNKDSHLHALHTAVFFDNFIEETTIHQLWKETFPELSMQKVSAGHHNPNDFLTKIISNADQIASGFDRERYDERQQKGRTDYRKVHLAPLLNHITLQNKSYKANYRYKLESLSPESIFPVPKEDVIKINVEEKYKKLIKRFENDYRKISNNYVINNYINSLQSIYEKHFSFVPASTWDDYDEISLYDHSKTTAAFATAIYNYLKEKNIKDISQLKNDDMFLLVRGEFFGIQKFIFGEGSESNKNPAKVLRGKSFFVSMLSEIAGQYCLNILNLPSFNLLLNAAGMFVVLAPNTDKNRKNIVLLKQEINNWLYNNFFGEVSFGIATTTAFASDFSEKRFEKLWLDLLTELEREKYTKFNLQNQPAVFENYYKGFDGGKLCKTCGKAVALKEDDCSFCFSFKDIGKKLVNNRFIYLLTNKEGKIFNKFDLMFSNELKDTEDTVKVIDLKPDKGFGGTCIAYINNYVPKKGDEPKSFEDMVSVGEKKEKKPLGVIKADVDNLGAIFAVGLEPYEHDAEMNYRLTFSRLSALSRMMNMFFSYYLPKVCENDFPEIYTVFAGGDDLFLIGPFDQIIELNYFINKEFKRFTGFNKEITLSSGISIFKHNTPVKYLAEATEEMLMLAKSKTGNMFDKGYMTLFNATAKPEDFESLSNDYDEIFYDSDEIDEKSNNSFWYKVLSLLDMRIRLNESDKTNIQNIMWLPRLKYLLARTVKDNEKREKYATFLHNAINEKPELLRAIITKNIYYKRHGG